MTNYKFLLNGLHCANCAGKIETAVSSHTSTNNTTLNFATKTISFECDNGNSENVKSWLQGIVDSIEDGVTVTLPNPEHKKESKKTFKIHSYVKIIISIIFLILALLCQHVFNSFAAVYIIMYGISVIVCGIGVISKGVKSLVKLKLDENTLMAIAVVAAFAIGDFAEAALVTLLFSVGEALENYAVEKSRRDIAKLTEIRPDSANLITPQGEKRVAAQKVVIGDTIMIKPFERVPLDCTVIDGTSDVDASALTGESVPVSAVQGSSLMSGMMNGEGMLKATVTKSYEQSSATRIIKMVEDAAASKGNSEKFITKFAKAYTPTVIALAVLVAVIPTIITGDFTTWLSRALVFLVASCPCAIVISVPLGFYAGIGGAAKAGVLIKGGKYLEALAKADSFVFDKTGTLSTGKLSVETIKAADNISSAQVLALAAAAESNSVHPAAVAIKEKAQGINLPKLTDYKEIAGIGVRAKQGKNTIMCGNYRILKNSAGEKGVIYVTLNDNLIGEISVSDTIRTESSDVTKKLKELGAKNLVMLTGDGEAAAKKVAEQCTITDAKWGLLPQDKVTAINDIKSKSTAVCFVGDGINDAPVLAMSDCGIAMGLGSEAAIEAADAVLTSGNLTHLPKAVIMARRVLNTVRSNIIFALGVKAIILILAVLGFAPMWLAVVADTGVCMLCVLNSTKLLNVKKIKV